MVVTKNGHRTPTIIVVKCGMPGEAKDKKPGNRGKRDSQLILMNFFSRVTYNDRMSPLDFDIFRKIQTLMGVTPDYFEVCLMVRFEAKSATDVRLMPIPRFIPIRSNTSSTACTPIMPSWASVAKLVSPINVNLGLP
jgi:hypothetical protein